MAFKTKPLAKPAPPSTALTPDAALLGPRVKPIEHMQLMSSDEWENLTCEWLYSLGLHARIEKYAGSGDQGLDVVAFESATNDEPWDSYQCKHYDHKLAPGDIWTELGKLVYYTFRGEYSVPRNHYFVAPHGAGTELSKLLHKPELVREGLLENWEKKCRTKITSKQDIQLDDDLKTYIDGFNFGIVTAVSPHAIINDLHSAPAVYVLYFGGGITKERAPVGSPPVEVQAIETNYVRALLDAYEHRLGTPLTTPAELNHQDLGAHFARSRHEFYSAESLREFSRDSVPAGTFESLLDDVHSGVVDVEQAQHTDAVERVLAVVKQAKALHITSNALIKVTRPADQGGMCHQLANDFRLRWRR
jgi:hypothetical protein